MDSVPEIPDDPAGVTYLQDAWATVDGWTAADGVLTYSGGILRNTATGTILRTQKTFAFGAGKTYRFRFKSSVSGTTGLLADVGSGLASQLEFAVVAGEWVIKNIYIAGAATLIQIRQALVAAGATNEIDFIYIGTGAYLPNSLIDNSGNGNHGTIYGATPVPGISGKALRRNGINNYIAIPNMTMPSVFFFHSWKLSGTMGASASVGIFNLGVVSGPHLWMYRLVNTPLLVISYWNGSGRAETAINNFFTGFDSTPMSYGVAINWTTGAVSAYRNGVLFGTAKLTTPSLPTTATAFLGSYQGTANLGGVETIEDEPRIYNRALSEAEVKYLYDNPGVPIPSDATVIYYADDAVLSTATATLEFTERYSGL